MSHFLLNRLISLKMRWNDFWLRRPLIAAAGQTELAQNNLLRKILGENAQTEFGRAHRFSSISSMTEFRKNVPVQDYDSLAPLINRQMAGEQTLTSEAPVYYARTSGTTGRHKDIPLTRDGLRQVRHAQSQLSISLWRDTDFLSGSILGFASPREEGRLSNGLAYGSMSGSTYASASPILLKKFALPASVFAIKDQEAKYQAYGLAVLAGKNLTGIATANPSSILKLVNLIDDSLQELLSSLVGQPSSWLQPEALSILPEIRERADHRHLKNMINKLHSGEELTSRDVWPKLSTVATWTGGSCGIAITQLKRRLPAEVEFVEIGYASSEFMGSTNIDARRNTCLPLLNHHVYEFVRRADWEANKPRFLGLHELQVGEDYYVFVTTSSGLYRYNINDIVRAERGVGDCPAIVFIQKGKGVTNITGEKLTEHQLIEAVSQCIAEQGVDAGGYLALADEKNSLYRFYLEQEQPSISSALEAALDEKLRKLNSEYDDKRASGRLQSLKLYRFRKNACETIRDWSVAEGVRESQYKPTVLAYARDWMPRLSELVQED